jgi:hypothetical protein
VLNIVAGFVELEYPGEWVYFKSAVLSANGNSDGVIYPILLASLPIRDLPTSGILP